MSQQYGLRFPYNSALDTDDILTLDEDLEHSHIA